MITKNIPLDPMKTQEIELASQDKVKAREEQVELILRELGHPYALVTDESIVADFFDFGRDDKEKEKKLSDTFDMRIRGGTLIYEIADILARRKQTGKKDSVIVLHDKCSIWERVKDIWYDFTFWTGLWKIKEVKNYLRQVFFVRRHMINTRLERGHWYDTDTRLLYGMMNLLMEYLEEEDPFETVDWDHDEFHSKVRDEIVAIRDWWLNYPNRLKEIENALTEWHNEAFFEVDKNDWISSLNDPRTLKAKQLHKKLSEMEEKLDWEESAMLIRLIKIRKHLWT